MSTKVFTSPRLVAMPSNWANWNKRVALVPSRMMDKVWGTLNQTTRLSKSVLVKADIDRTWEVVSDPNTIAHYVDSVVGITETDEGFDMEVAYVSEETGKWAKDTLQARIVEKKEPGSFKFAFNLPEGHTETIGYQMEEAEDGTVVTQYFEVDGKLITPEQDEERMEGALKRLVELIMGTDQFNEMVRNSLTD